MTAATRGSCFVIPGSSCQDERVDSHAAEDDAFEEVDHCPAAPLSVALFIAVGVVNNFLSEFFILCGVGRFSSQGEDNVV